MLARQNFDWMETAADGLRHGRILWDRGGGAVPMHRSDASRPARKPGTQQAARRRARRTCREAAPWPLRFDGAAGRVPRQL